MVGFPKSGHILLYVATHFESACEILAGRLVHGVAEEYLRNIWGIFGGGISIVMSMHSKKS